jgi:K+-sensing histidine kinase KdpD
MKGTDTDLIYTGGGPLAAALLGVALMPLRGYTVPSNFTFAFLALTILVAEFGGRWAAVTTALVSALSLDFFLTQPYLRLAIAEKHDLIAFVGLAGCSLLAAALGSRRRERVADLRAARTHADAVHSALGELGRPGPLAARLIAIVDAALGTFPLAGVAVRDTAGELLVVAPRGLVLTPAPELVLAPDTLLTWEQQAQNGAPDIPLPKEGARLALLVESRPVGWLELWGSGAPASAESRRALAAVARVVAALLAATWPGKARLPSKGPQE